MLDIASSYSAFEGACCIAHGGLEHVALAAKRAMDRAASNPTAPAILVFSDSSSETLELDWRGSDTEFAARLDAVVARHPAPAAPEAEPGDIEAPRGPGRPKLGVVAREVTLLPRHWEWLGSQPGGASVALRKLVDVARRTSEARDRVRHSSAVGYKFMSTMAGHEPGFEEASRALFAGDQAGFETHIANWPADVQTHLKRILTDAFSA